MSSTPFLLQCLSCLEVLADNAATPDALTTTSDSSEDVLSLSGDTVPTCRIVDDVVHDDDAKPGCSFNTLACAKCHIVVGRRYVTVSNDFAALRGHLRFDKSKMREISFGVENLHWQTVDLTSSESERQLVARHTELKASLVQLSRKAKDCSVRLAQVTAVAADVSRVKRAKQST